MVVSTSLGAQVFKIPITKLIHKEPISLINFFNYFVGALLLFFIGAITTVYLSTLVRSAKDKYETEEKEIGTKLVLPRRATIVGTLARRSLACRTRIAGHL